MDLTPCLSPAKDAVLLAVKVQPRASREELCGLLGGHLKIKVTAPPVDAAANTAVLQFLARCLDCSRSALTLRRGRTSRLKTIAITGLALEEVARRLERHLP